MAMCPYFGGDQKSGKSFQIRCSDSKQKVTLSFTDEQKFLNELKACTGGNAMYDCRPFLFRQLEEMGEKPTSENSTERLHEWYLERLQSNEQEEKKQMDEMIVHDGDMSPQYKQAVEVTRRIKMNGSIAAEAVYQVCKDLKLMRDQKLYIELGFDSFDEYSEAAVGIKARQAYNYISTYERLGDSFLQSNANLGITKLSLLAEAPPTERASLDNHDLAGKSTREVEELVKKLKDTGEQLSLMTDERDRAKEEAGSSAEEVVLAQEAKEKAEQERRDAAARLAEANEKIRKLEEAAKIQPDASDGPTPEEIAKIEKDAENRIRTEMEKKHAEDLREAKQVARAAGEKAGEKSVKESLSAMEKEKAAALVRAAELEKKLSVAGNQETVIILHLSEELQMIFGKLMETIAKARESDAATADKFKGATGRLLDMLREQLKEVQ